MHECNNLTRIGGSYHCVHTATEYIKGIYALAMVMKVRGEWPLLPHVIKLWWACLQLVSILMKVEEGGWKGMGH